MKEDESKLKRGQQGLVAEITNQLGELPSLIELGRSKERRRGAGWREFVILSR